MKHVLIIMLLIFVMVVSCTDTYTSADCETPDYSNCNTFRPITGQLYIKLTINSENQKIPIAIYKGKIETNNLFIRDTVTSENYSKEVDIDYYYSVKATYQSGGKTIIAVDGDDVKSKSNLNCDSTCWSVEDGNADVRLKY